MIKILSLIWIMSASINGCKKSDDFQEELNYSFITNVYSENNKNFVDVDYVQYFTGKEAIEKAKENDDADVRVVNGEKIYSIPNDFYIVNENTKIRKFELLADVKIHFVDNQDLSETDSKSVFNRLKNDYNDRLYILKIVDKKITEINEVFIP